LEPQVYTNPALSTATEKSAPAAISMMLWRNLLSSSTAGDWAPARTRMGLVCMVVPVLLTPNWLLVLEPQA